MAMLDLYFVWVGVLLSFVSKTFLIWKKKTLVCKLVLGVPPTSILWSSSWWTVSGLGYRTKARTTRLLLLERCSHRRKALTEPKKWVGRLIPYPFSLTFSFHVYWPFCSCQVPKLSHMLALCLHSYVLGRRSVKVWLGILIFQPVTLFALCEYVRITTCVRNTRLVATQYFPVLSHHLS